MSIPEYSQMFNEINRPLTTRQIQSVEVTKTFKGHNSSATVEYQPGFIQLSGQVQHKNFSAQQTLSSELNSVSQVGFHSDSMAANAIMEVTPLIVQPTIVEQLLGKNNVKTSFTSNFRSNAVLRSDNSVATVMYNQRGNIVAGSFHQKCGKFSTGCEMVNVVDKDLKMYAVGATFENEKVKAVAQTNSSKSGAIGVLVKNVKNCQVSSKVQLKYTDKLEYQGQVGLSKMFSRGQVSVSVGSDKTVNADVRAVVGQNVLCQVCLNGDITSGNVQSGLGIVF
ncbi:Tom40 [Hexamita inflata]|uniref:Tom40 n=1 Tax=Hexamita inflata TaxID=28002 RepID=A0AA86PV87_9EUKA|nr:Tom40 [Hexamita inflata]